MIDEEILLKIINNIESVTKKPEKYLSLQEQETEKIKLLTKNLYNFSKKKENTQKKNVNILEELVIADLDEEQIWQQVKLQNNVICNNLVNDISHLLAKKSKLIFPLKENVKKFQESEYINEKIEKCKEREIERINESKEISKNKNEPIKSSIVDDKFFKLQEMNNFLEKIEKEQELSNEISEEKLDYFEDNSLDFNDDSKELYYDDFFDQPYDGEYINEKKRKNIISNIEKNSALKKVKFSLQDTENEQYNFNITNKNEGDISSNEEENYNYALKQKSINKVNENNEKNDNEEKEKVLSKHFSTFEAKQERLKTRISFLEKEALKEKPWQLKGEVTANNRPQNSLLEEYVEFDHASRPAPILTEKTTVKLEDIIIQRIKDKAWDNVVRKIKPVETEMEYKKKLVLQQEKSKLSLAQIYEQEYLQQLDTKNEDLREKPEIEPQEHQEIKLMMNKLFSKLDALSNFHFTPKQCDPEIKIINNLPAINMEEVAPVAMSDATLLAPEEVKSKLKGDLIGKNERSATDKKRERRKKKLKQKLRHKKNETKIKFQLENQSLKKHNNKNLSQKLLQKITKSSNITQLKKVERKKKKKII